MQRNRLGPGRSGSANGIFNLTVLDLLLANDAVRGPRHGLQALLANQLAAMLALAKCAVTETVKSRAYLRQLGVALGTLQEHEFFLVGLDGKVGSILQIVSIALASLFDGCDHIPLKKSLLRVQLLFKAL